MDWIILIASGVMESVWATALGKSDALSRLLPSVIFAVALIASMIGLAQATKTLPMGTAYAVWTGIGASLTVAFGMITGSEPASIARIGFICGIIGCVVGLKVVSS